MQICAAAQNQPVAEHPVLLHPGHQDSADQFPWHRAGLRQGEHFVQTEGLLPCLHAHPDGVRIAQQLHRIGNLFRREDLTLSGHIAFTQGGKSGANHDLSGGYGPGIHKPCPQICPDMSLRGS